VRHLGGQNHDREIMPLTDFGSVSYAFAFYFPSSSGDITAYASTNTTRIDLYQNGAEADSVGALGTDGAFTVTYGPPPPPPPTDKVTVTSPGSQSATAGTAAALQIHAVSSTGAAITSYAASGLPPGMSIDSTTGRISGTPRTAGTYSVKVTATDTTGTTGSASFTWTIETRRAEASPMREAHEDDAAHLLASSARCNVIFGPALQARPQLHH
jgi:hypothetical protein